ncbi:MAG: hypothetical protein DRJ01_16075 [Bacteroidetes bacterium]|nr:MAG: hypothetical protein DRJ01_16075 [Bacteroidota bacterium]
MDKEKLLNQFKRKNKKLFELSQKIIVTGLEEDWNSETNEVIVHNPPIYQIEVWRPFLFDVRLIPTEFDGIKVVDQFFGSYPSEFPSDNAALPLEEFEAPERYVKFVNNNIGLISNKIKIPNLTREEALDALTGDFKKHINWCIKMRIDRVNEEKDNIAFFNKLLYEIRQAYYLSDIYNIYKEKEWYYSVTSTKFSKNKPLIVGLNWGVDNNWINNGNKYSPQCNYPFSTFEGLHDDLGSFKRTIPLFHKYFTSALFGMQTNLCFFRSEKENQLTKKDIELCTPIFDKLIKYTSPSCIIVFSKEAHNYFINREHRKINTESFSTDKKTIYFSKGKVIINNKEIDYYHLPHPNSYRFHKTEYIEKVWELCFRNIQ